MSARPKRIVVIKPDGTEREFDHVPNLKEMQQIVGGYIEHVRVLREDLPGFVYTSMYVNETGLIDGLPHNERATAIYQANTRRAYPGSPNPFRESHEEFKDKAEAIGAVLIDANPAGFADDPHIVGTAIWFDGYTVEEANAAFDAAAEARV